MCAGVAEACGNVELCLVCSPKNVLLSPRGEALLADFGLSQSVHAAHRGQGTPDYMAPEIYRGTIVENPHDKEKADVWSTGVLLFELLARSTDRVRARDIPLDATDATWSAPIPAGIDPRLKNFLRLMLKIELCHRPTCGELLKTKEGDAFIAMALEWLAKRRATYRAIAEHSLILLLYVSEIITWAIRTADVYSHHSNANDRLLNSLFYDYFVAVQCAINIMCLIAQIIRIFYTVSSRVKASAVSWLQFGMVAVLLVAFIGLDAAAKASSSQAFTNKVWIQFSLNFCGYVSLFLFWVIELSDAPRDITENDVLRLFRNHVLFYLHMFMSLEMFVMNFVTLSTMTTGSMGHIMYFSSLFENILLLELAHVALDVYAEDPLSHHESSLIVPCVIPPINCFARGLLAWRPQEWWQRLEYALIMIFYLSELVTYPLRLSEVQKEPENSPARARFDDPVKTLFWRSFIAQFVINVPILGIQVIRTLATTAEKRVLSVSRAQFIGTIIPFLTLIILECCIGDWWFMQAALSFSGYLFIILFWSIEMSVPNAKTSWLRIMLFVLHCSFFAMVFIFSIIEVSDETVGIEGVLYAAEMAEIVLLFEIFHTILEVLRR